MGGKRSPRRTEDSPQSHNGHEGKSPILLGDLGALGGESISLAFGQEETSAEKSQRNRSNCSVALWSYLAAPVSLEESSR